MRQISTPPHNLVITAIVGGSTAFILAGVIWCSPRIEWIRALAVPTRYTVNPLVHLCLRDGVPFSCPLHSTSFLSTTRIEVVCNVTPNPRPGVLAGVDIRRMGWPAHLLNMTNNQKLLVEFKGRQSCLSV